MKVSIAMATYNGAKYLPDQLQSFLDQTRLPDELIVTDDGSTDGTVELVESFARRAPFVVRVIQNEEKVGYAQNFGRAIELTRGDLVFLSDQDDVWFADKVESMVLIAAGHPEMFLFMNDAALTDANLNDSGLTKLGQIQSSGGVDAQFITGSCCVLRRDFLDFCMPVPMGIKGHDNWFVNLADELHIKLIVARTMQYYRRHEDNESQVITNQTERATRLDRLRQQLERSSRGRSREWALQELTQREIFSAGLKASVVQAPGSYRQEISKLQEKVDAQIYGLHRRLEIRSMRMPARLMGILKYFFAGGYQSAAGYKSAVRDILG